MPTHSSHSVILSDTASFANVNAVNLLRPSHTHVRLCYPIHDDGYPKNRARSAGVGILHVSFCPNSR